MSANFTKRSVIGEIGCAHLKLYKGEGYWYFCYDNGRRYATHSVPVMRLNQLPLADWIEEGRSFVAKMEAA